MCFISVIIIVAVVIIIIIIIIIILLLLLLLFPNVKCNTENEMIWPGQITEHEV